MKLLKMIAQIFSLRASSNWPNARYDWKGARWESIDLPKH